MVYVTIDNGVRYKVNRSGYAIPADQPDRLNDDNIRGRMEGL